MASEITSEAVETVEPVFGGDVNTVLASPKIAPPPATLEEARNAPGRDEKIAEITRRIDQQGISSCSSSRCRSPAG